QVRWKRGTELPSPKLPRSAQLTTGKNFTPISRSHAPTSSRARVTYCSAQRRGHTSSGSNSAIRSQSSSARRSLSGILVRRCSGESTMNMPPKASRASPPISWGLQRSSKSTVCPLRSSSSVLTRPASPAPTTITSGCPSLIGRAPGRVGSGCIECKRHQRPSLPEHYSRERHSGCNPHFDKLGLARGQRRTQSIAKLLDVADDARFDPIAARHGGHVERRQVQARCVHDVLEHAEPLEDRVLVVAQHEKSDGHVVGGCGP